MAMGMAKSVALEGGSRGGQSALALHHVDPTLAGSKGLGPAFSIPSSKPHSKGKEDSGAHGSSSCAGVAFEPVLLRVEGSPMAPNEAATSEEGAGIFRGYRLVPKPPGSLGSLVPEPVPAATTGQVSVRVHAVGLNFRDLLMVGDHLPVFLF
jgi:hypothetical protein